MYKLLFVLLTSPTFLFAKCPEVPARSDQHISLMKQIASAPDEMTAADLSNQLWEIWTMAPDDIAQEILLRGMQKRASYDFIGAIEDFTTLVAYCPNYAEGYNQRAFVYFLSEDYEAALADLDSTIAIVPDHIGAIAGRALTLFGMNRDKEGQLTLRAALALNPWLSERHLLKPLEDDET